MDMRATELASGREVLPHRFGGWPIPEQDDPRYAAAAAIDEWTMLFQVGISEICTSFAEGTVYFVMREADLHAQNFDRVHAIYQQT